MFPFDDSLLTGLYTPLFLVGLVLPGWRSLAVAGCAAVAFGIFAAATAGGSAASALGLGFILTIVAGLCCGLLARAATLWIAPFGRHPYRFIAIALIGYVVPPIVFSGPAATMAWLQRPSQRVCAASTYRMTAANQVLHVPAAPVFAVDVLHSMASTNVRHLGFDSEHGLKELCGRVLRDGEVIGPIALNLYPWKFGGSQVESWAAATCPATRDTVHVLLCRLTAQDHPGRRLDRATIYGPEMAKAVARDSNYAVEKLLHQRLAAGPSPEALPPMRAQIGAFEIYPDGLRIARTPDWVTESGEPFVLVCAGDESSKADKALFCVAADAVARGLHVRFLFRTNGERLTADTRAIRLFLRELAAKLRTDTQPS